MRISLLALLALAAIMACPGAAYVSESMETLRLKDPLKEDEAYWTRHMQETDMSVPSLSPVSAPTPPTPPPPPVNSICFTKLAALHWSWYLCNIDPAVNDTCTVQDKRVPPKTTFLGLFSGDRQPRNCTDFTFIERNCVIPADHWIVLPVAAYRFVTDFVSVVNTSVAGVVDNTIDTPELAKMDSNEAVDTVTNVTTKIDGDEIFVPRYESKDLCNLETMDLEGCSSPYNFLDGWKIFSDGYWLRIPPTLGKGNHTIEIFHTRPVQPASGELGCVGTKYKITVV